ncbi:hypothetical protein Calkro_0641 [Caldicellulosiruptor kronotskyensis 2002]|uniref:Uncharacterized protein n=1 Tax=Caldicellulosiruptor kronotskyensis (strain DSM 18902 / VKM B-2412 / 2002) TaxID=632348 RepID=E4SEP8_CALK2|nr:ABC-three component system middle component 6 [Caldicellulosiruptor kronotskyensis]ADQ45535.1 hypothetical protein Calkro_0641 [Caldicellulosiruptor kronotskyensis 2002]
MIFPNKTTKLSYSLLGCGSYILQELKNPQTVSALWEKVKIKYKELKNFEKFILTLDFLYILGMIEFENGLLRRSKEDD